MDSPASLPPPARSWRDIPQEIAPRAMSREGRRRLAFSTVKTLVGCAVLAVSLWAGYELYSTWVRDPKKIAAPVKSSIVRQVLVRTDGVVTQDWVTQQLALPKGADLMELNLERLRDRLLAFGQLKTAVLTRRFPDTLVVALEERSPVARTNIIFNGGEPVVYCVARDGVPFLSINHRSEVLASLPFIEGARLKKQGDGLAPIEGMETVTDLLIAARANIPTRFASWRVISLHKLYTDGTLRVRTTEIPEILFGTRDDFTKQIAQLDYVLDELAIRAPDREVESINLSVGVTAIGAQVFVAFVPGAGEGAPAPASENSPRSLFPSRDQASAPLGLFPPQRSTSL